jgi:hypothetical protein
MLFTDRQRDLLGQAITLVAAGLLFLRYSSTELRFTIAGFILVLFAFLFLAAALGLVVRRLNGLRGIALRWGGNLWFALMIVGLARVVVAAIATTSPDIPDWLSTAILWIGIAWFLGFAGVFITLAVSEITSQFRRDGTRRGITNTLTNAAWVFGVSSILLLIMTDLDIRYGLAMLGVSVVALATRLMRREDNMNSTAINCRGVIGVSAERALHRPLRMISTFRICTERPSVLSRLNELWNRR